MFALTFFKNSTFPIDINNLVAYKFGILTTQSLYQVLGIDVKDMRKVEASWVPLSPPLFDLFP
jgi:hypothetical protein